jgi:uncharacterized membrane protein YphA (DoxX/SURF4 family)
MKPHPNQLAILILRLGGGICFLGHGLLALGAKAGFVGLLGSFGLDEAQAVTALKVIGCVDVLVGLSILLKPNKRVLQWALAWTTLTIVAWGLHGDSLMDLARRAPYMTTPLALLFLLFQGESASEKAAPSSDQADESPGIPTQFHLPAKDKIAAIHQLDLSLICMKLMDADEGPGWTERQCAEVAREYRRFLTLHLLHPGEPIVPNRAVDTFWHGHILDTAAYQRDCEAVFGWMLHHYPYFGMPGKGEERQFMNACERTKQLYEQTFEESMDGPGYLPSFQMRQSA